MAALSLAIPVSANAAQLAKYGDWIVGKDEDFIEASTNNEMSENVAILCFQAQPDCRWGFTLITQCNEKSLLTSILNNGKDTAQMSMFCLGADEKQSTIGVVKNKEFEKFLSEGKNFFTVDFGTSGGIHKFSLNGMAKAVADARSRTKAAATSK
jgi:hypothetical protein